jgi:hypothetical protein
VSYIYDPPAVFLFTLSLALMAERRWTAYAVAFTLTTLNKETSILLALVWALFLFRRLPWRQFLTGLGLQVGGWLAIRCGIVLLFRDNGGAIHYDTLARNLDFLDAGLGVFPILSKRNYFDAGLPRLYPRLLGVLYLGLVPLIIPALWHAGRFLRAASAIILPLLVLTLFFGFIDELRDYYEFYPVAFMVLARALYRLFQPRTGRKEGTGDVLKIITFSAAAVRIEYHGAAGAAAERSPGIVDPYRRRSRRPVPDRTRDYGGDQAGG